MDILLTVVYTVQHRKLVDWVERRGNPSKELEYKIQGKQKALPSSQYRGQGSSSGGHCTVSLLVLLHFVSEAISASVLTRMIPDALSAESHNVTKNKRGKQKAKW